ncbi:MAG: trypsin-like peptidase domain-containing protein [Candidatus Dormibacteraeota bacterium]|nr:trypsin-like peptidase domain-containing protein [Candidatus Dormibacteraeota bacterium]
MASEPPSPPPYNPLGSGAHGPYHDPHGYGAWGYQPWMEPPPPPQARSTGRWLVAVLLIGMIIGGTAAGVALLVTRGSTFPFTTSSGGGAVSGSVSNVELAVVDVTSKLTGDQGIAAGTGMVVTTSGEVLTNNHVIEGADEITVQIDGSGPQYSANVVGDDPVHDVALLQIQGASNLATVTLGDSSAISVGDPVTAIGNALGQGGTPTVTSGSITGLGETISVDNETGGTETLNNLIEMNAQIQPGDSGGPLINSQGKVVGMDTAAEVSTPRRNAQSTAGYAIPINDAAGIIHQIQQGGGGSSTVQTGNPPVIGVEVASDSSGSAQGVPISGVQSGSPAQQAGMAAGDVITAIDGTNVTNATDLRTAIRQHKVGDEVTVHWLDASGQSHSAQVKLIAGPPA